MYFDLKFKMAQNSKNLRLKGHTSFEFQTCKLPLLPYFQKTSKLPFFFELKHNLCLGFFKNLYVPLF